MSRNFVVLGKAAAAAASQASRSGSPPPTAAGPVEPLPPSGEYSELIRRLFQRPAAVAIIGSNRADFVGGVSRIAEDLASELAASGKRVVVVLINKLLGMNPITGPDETAFMPGNSPQVWHWPAPAGHKIEFFKSREPDERGNWLDALHRNFDAVLLDCPEVEGGLGVTEVAAMADAAVLVVEAGNTSRQQVQQDQRALLLRGAKVGGCILVRRS